MSIESEKFEKWFSQIYNNYFNAKIHLEIYWLLVNKSRIKFINKYKYYFSFDVYAHLSIGTLCLLKIFDNNKDSINIKKFLNYCIKNNLKINNNFNSCKFTNIEENNKIKNEIKILNSDIKELKNWRNKEIAHKERGFQIMSIKWQSFNNIINFLEKNFLDYGSKPNHLFPKPNNLKLKIIKNIEKFFDKYFI